MGVADGAVVNGDVVGCNDGSVDGVCVGAVVGNRIVWVASAIFSLNTATAPGVMNNRNVNSALRFKGRAVPAMIRVAVKVPVVVPSCCSTGEARMNDATPARSCLNVAFSMC